MAKIAVRRSGIPIPTREFMFAAALPSSPGIGIGIGTVANMNPNKGIHVCSSTCVLTSTVPQEVDEQQGAAKNAGDKAREGDVVRYQEVVRERDPRKEENEKEDDWEHGQLD